MKKRRPEKKQLRCKSLNSTSFSISMSQNKKALENKIAIDILNFNPRRTVIEAIALLIMYIIKELLEILIAGE